MNPLNYNARLEASNSFNHDSTVLIETIDKRSKPQNKYNLDLEQLQGVSMFFKKYNINNLLSNKLLYQLMMEALVLRNGVMCASANDIERVINVVDSNQDENVFNLFLASE